MNIPRVYKNLFRVKILSNDKIFVYKFFITTLKLGLLKIIRKDERKMWEM